MRNLTIEELKYVSGGYFNFNGNTGNGGATSGGNAGSSNNGNAVALTGSIEHSHANTNFNGNAGNQFNY